MPNDLPISALPVDPNVSGSELVPIVDPAATPKNRNATIQTILSLVTKASLGLGNVNNTSDLNKPISTATAAALVGKAAAGPIGDSGLTMTAGLLGRESGTGAPVVLTLSGLGIVNGVLTVTATGSGTVTSVGLSVPTGFAVAGSPVTTTGTLALTFAAGYSLPLTATQAGWDAAAVLAGTAVQPAGLASTLTGYVQTSDARLTDSREWSATTISQAEAEAGSATTRRAFTAQRIFQAAAAWWAATASATGQALATAANAAAARTTLGLGSAATAASTDFATAAQGAKADTAVQTSDSRLSDSREWSAATATQAEAEAGTSTTRLAFTPQRVFQAIAAWWAASAAKAKLDGIASGATANSTDAQLRDRSTHTGTQPAGTITGLAAVATSGAYGDLSGRLVVSSSAPAALGATAAAGSTGQAADAGHVHQRDTDVIVIPVGDETTALTAGTNKVRFRMPFPATLLAVRDGVNIAPTGSSLIVDINEAGTSVLGTKLSIDATETSSTTAASAATITDSSLADDAEISIDIDQVGSTVAGAGLKVYLFVRRA
jgi:hypothetical protein